MAYKIIPTDTVILDENGPYLAVIDQTLLPAETRLLRLSTPDSIRSAIRNLVVRGAPAIGVAAAIGLYVCAARAQGDLYRCTMAAADRIKSARPTAVNLSWAINRMMAVMDKYRDAPEQEALEALKAEALSIRDEDVQMCRDIGLNGLKLIKNGDGVLTHCNAGRLAAVRYGTALAPIYLAKEKGLKVSVYADETRPLMQGARLTVHELRQADIDVTLLCDSMAASLMKEGKIQSVFVGCDRVAANGDTANKIGTLGVAVLAKHFGIPFYVCAPSSTIDLACPSGERIPIERRDGGEVTDMWFSRPMAVNAKVYNPAFDITEAALITAFVTERGVLYPPFDFAGALA